MKKCLLLLIITTAIFSCQSREEGKTTKNQGIIFGFSMDSFVVERWQRDRDVFQAKAKELGAQVIFQNANEDHETQVRQIQQLADKGISVLLVVPNDSLRLAPILRQVKSRGIRVISYDRLARGAGVDLYISFDNVAVGTMMADYLIAKQPQGKFLVLNGAKPDYNSYMINQGIHNVLDQKEKRMGFSVLKEGWLETWSSNEATDFFRDALQQFPSITGIIAANDLIAEAAIRTFSEKQRLNGLQVVGMDAELSACQRVAEGTQLMTVYKPIDQLSTAAAEMAFTLAKGEALTGTELFQDGNEKIPFLKLKPTAVTADNLMDTVIKDGFHGYDAVYRNIPINKRPIK